MYAYLDTFSASAFEAFKIDAPKKDIHLAESVIMKDEPEEEDYNKYVAQILGSDCAATIIVTQTVPAAEIVYQARKKGYGGEFLVDGLLMSMHANLHEKAKKEGEDVNYMLRGMFALSPFYGVGTSK